MKIEHKSFCLLANSIQVFFKLSMILLANQFGHELQQFSHHAGHRHADPHHNHLPGKLSHRMETKGQPHQPTGGAQQQWRTDQQQRVHHLGHGPTDHPCGGALYPSQPGRSLNSFLVIEFDPADTWLPCHLPLITV